MKSYFAVLRKDCDYDESLKAMQRYGASIDTRLPLTRCASFKCDEGALVSIRNMPSVQTVHEGRVST